MASAYGDGTIGLISNEINYAWIPGSDTAIELAPTWCKDTAVARSPVIYAENGTMALVKVSDRTVSTPQLTPEGLPYQRQQTFSDLALISLQDLFSGSHDWDARRHAGRWAFVLISYRRFSERNLPYAYFF